LNDDSKIWSIFEEFSNLMLFAERYKLDKSKFRAVDLGKFIASKIYRLEKHLKDLPSDVNVSLGNSLKLANEKSERSFLAYNSLKNSADYNDILFLLKNLHKKKIHSYIGYLCVPLQVRERHN
jgi:hypothetical protein